MDRYKDFDNTKTYIGLVEFLDILSEHRWFIFFVVIITSFIGWFYSNLSTVIYQADALIQVENKNASLSSLSGEISDFFSQNTSTSAEVEIIKSRMVLGKTVDALELTTVINLHRIPIVGKIYELYTKNENTIEINEFEVPMNQLGDIFTIKVIDAINNKYQLFDKNKKLISTGDVGSVIDKNGVKLVVSALNSDSHVEFKLIKITRLAAIQMLNNNLTIDERGIGTGILRLSYTGSDPYGIKKILADICQNYFLQNVARKSAVAENSIKFLVKHLPEVKSQLTDAEDKLNKFRQINESVNLNLEAESTLDSIVGLERQLNDLHFMEIDLSQKFTTEHPEYLALLEKRKTLFSMKKKLDSRIENLPKTQRQIVRLMRDVEVNQQIYVQLLNKVQELNIVKASSVGNVRIIDSAETNLEPIKPNKILINLGSVFGGFLFAVILVFIKSYYLSGIKDAGEIEALGITVYSNIPFSKWSSMTHQKYKKNKWIKIDKTLLALSNPVDLTIESLRSLRTALHFSMLEASNNIIVISGPTPNVGKSFISANLAAVIAQANKKILLIDGDMRKGVIDKHCAISNQFGLYDYLEGKASVESLVCYSGINNLDVITSGTGANPSEILMNSRLSELMQWCSSHYDIVLIDSPPLLAVTDATIIAAHAATTLLVARYEQTTSKEIETTVARFKQNGIQVKGAILNGVSQTKKYYGDYLG